MENQIKQNVASKITFQETVLIKIERTLDKLWQIFRCIQCSGVVHYTQTGTTFQKVGVLFKYRGKVKETKYLNNSQATEDLFSIFELMCYKCKILYRIGYTTNV